MVCGGEQLTGVSQSGLCHWLRPGSQPAAKHVDVCLWHVGCRLILYACQRYLNPDSAFLCNCRQSGLQTKHQQSQGPGHQAQLCV